MVGFQEENKALRAQLAGAPPLSPPNGADMSWADSVSEALNTAAVMRIRQYECVEVAEEALCK
eukprot:scaffold102826_cov30-Prasinocladus_malaysianus.AAC.1